MMPKRIAMSSPKRSADHNVEDPSTPKHRKILTYLDNTPHASPIKMYLNSSIDQGIPGSSDRPVTPSSSSVLQSSKTTLSSRASLDKGFRYLQITKNPVARSDNVLKIPSMGLNLYNKL